MPTPEWSPRALGVVRPLWVAGFLVGTTGTGLAALVPQALFATFVLVSDLPLARRLGSAPAIRPDDGTARQ